jgi:glycerol-3-phosphate acyltransferase PlsY
MIPAALVIAAYLAGAVPFGFLIGRLHGVDIRQVGSRNIGATNVSRALGRKWGLLCLALDLLKGLVPTAVAGTLLTDGGPTLAGLLLWLAVGVAAVVGHVFPVYLRFRGGKGVATTVGVALGLFPYYTGAMLVALACYAAVRFGTGLVSLGSLTIAVVFPAALYPWLRWLGLRGAQFWLLEAIALLLGLLILVRHVGNVRRLWRGQELPSAPAARGPPPDRAGLRDKGPPSDPSCDP